MFIPNRPCYRCEEGRPAIEGQGVCEVCRRELAERASRPPEAPRCRTCDYHFVTDWERVKHELGGAHHYRAWRG